MAIVIPCGFNYYNVCVQQPSTGFSTTVTPMSMLSVQRDPTDPLFYASLLINNIVVGSTYWIAIESDLTTVLATGVAGSTSFSVTNIPVYSNPMLITIRVRKSGYLPFETNTNLAKDGSSAYISQVEDTIYQ